MIYKKSLISLFSSYFYVFFSIIINILYVPIAIKFMGIEEYGFWVIIGSLINYLSLGNFGIPYVVTNLVSQADNNLKMHELLLKGFKLLFLISSVLAFIFFILFYSDFFKFFVNSSQLEMVLISIVCFFLLKMPLQISFSIFNGIKQTYLSKIYDSISLSLNLLSLLITIYLHEDLFFLSVFYGLSSLLLSFIGFCHSFYLTQFFKFKINSNFYSTSYIFNKGAVLFFTGISSIVIWNTDNFIISNYIGLKEVTLYSTTFRIFAISYSLFTIIYGLLIPYYGEYFSKMQYFKLKTIFLVSIDYVPYFASVVGLILWIFSKNIILLWFGNYDLYPGRDLSFVFCIYGIIFSYTSSMNTLLTSLHQTKFLVIISILEACLNIFLSILFSKNLGLIGVALGTLLSSIISLIFLPFLIKNNHTIKVNLSFSSLIMNLIINLSFLFFLYFLKIDEFSLFLKSLFLATAILFNGILIYFKNKNSFLEFYKLYLRVG